MKNQGSEPFAGFPLVETKRVDEAEHLLGRALTTCRIHQQDPTEKFSFRMNGCRFGKTTLSFNRYDTHTVVKSQLPGEPLFFNVGCHQPSTFRTAKSSAQLLPGKTVLQPNAPKMEIDRAAGSGMLILRAWMPDLEGHLETLSGRHHRGRLSFGDSAEMDSPEAESLKRLIYFIAGETAANREVMQRPFMVKRYEDLLLSSLLALPHNRREALFQDRTHEHSPHLVARAEEYMRAHLGDAVTIADLVTLCECSRSALFAAFHNARGYSPLEFHTEIRLQEAHRRLKDKDGSVSITTVAMDCGFTHLGRFSKSYRQRFGETPSATRRATRGGNPK
ncbi:helix-turn-helix domain-containing protein [Haloferula sp.]|uniref:AraC family transcriptional regulator n=1 Tax=Haloferula sp. TaxID=2497595 RepID=UPI00329A8FF7